MDKQDHEIEMLVPLWVNGRASKDERRSVEAALLRNPGLRAEASRLSFLRQEMRDEPARSTPGDLVLARLHRSIDADRPVRMRQAALFLAGALAATVVFALVLWNQPPASVALGGGEYRQASGEGAAGAFTVLFRQDASAGQIGTFLHDNHLTVVDGPSAIGLYRLQPDPDANIDDTLATLRNAGNLIESADPNE